MTKILPVLSYGGLKFPEITHFDRISSWNQSSELWNFVLCL